jgi:AraC-like DNA-binding protein
MNAINPSLIREAVLAGLMPSGAIEKAEPVALLSSALHVMVQLAGSREASMREAEGRNEVGAKALASASDEDASYADSLVHTLIGSLLASLDARQDVAQDVIDRATLELRDYLIPDLECDEPSKPAARVALSPWQERRAKELMSSQMDKGLSIARVASECSLSRSHFSRAFKKNTGLSPRDWFLQMRLDKAKGLLSGSLLSISQISLDCGFADQSHFTRVFTRVVGTTPFTWRRSQCGDRSKSPLPRRLCAS